jgi:hypothetical protein
MSPPRAGSTLELVINLKTLGVTPETLLATADEVIQ